MPDGLHYARIVSVTTSEVTLDPIGWYGGDAAAEVATRRGETDLVDYYIVDDDHTVQELRLAPAVVITSVWADYGAEGCELCPGQLGLGRFVDLVNDPPQDVPASHVAGSPYRITITDGAVTRVGEQYVP